MANAKDISTLLNSVGSVARQQRQIDLLKGEKFNLFSILGVEHSENKTHSAFLIELLNPTGTHGMGAVFLKLFLHKVKYSNALIDIETISVTPEKGIGPVDYEKKTGGRVDIYLSANGGHTICIENKIHAGDQFVQIERYCNHNKAKNKVYYLTPMGGKPSKESAGTLEEGKDYFCISYKVHILEWLQTCLKETSEQPILRESIRQYIILIKKITGTMDTANQQELNNLILGNYEAAHYVVSNANIARRALAETIRLEVLAQLADLLDKNLFTVESGETTKEARFSQVWIKLKGFEKSPMRFGIESFTGEGHEGGYLFTGIFNGDYTNKEFSRVNNMQNFAGGWWVNVEKMGDLDGYKIHLNEPDTIQQLHLSADFKAKFIQHIVTTAYTYVTQHHQLLLQHLTPTQPNVQTV